MVALKLVALSVLLLQSTVYINEVSASALSVKASIADGNVCKPQRRICDFNDSECLSKAAVLCYPTCIGGGPSWEASIPFINCGTIDNSILPSIVQTLTNVTLSGMDTCSPTLVDLMPDNTSFIYHVSCKEITVEADIKTKGGLCSEDLEAQEHYKITEKGLLFKFVGVYSDFNDKNGQPHIKVESFKLEVENSAQSKCENKKSLSDDGSSYWNLVNNKLKSPILQTCLSKFMGNTNDYIIYTPLIDYFYYID